MKQQSKSLLVSLVFKLCSGGLRQIRALKAARKSGLSILKKPKMKPLGYTLKRD
jgi:hypothetical protein